MRSYHFDCPLVVCFLRKSMNILLDAGQNAKICDFGLAHQMCMECPGDCVFWFVDSIPPGWGGGEIPISYWTIFDICHEMSSATIGNFMKSSLEPRFTKRGLPQGACCSFAAQLEHVISGFRHATLISVRQGKKASDQLCLPR